MASKFTWFPTLTKSLEKMPEGPRGKMLWMLVQYGTNGIEPDFGDDWHSEALFTSLSNDIDNSIAARNKNKGGRPRKDAKAETGVSENGNCGFGVSETAETGVSEPENPSLYTSPYQSIPSQANAGQCIAPDAPEGFEPPTAEEVAAYFGVNCLNGDPQAFFDFYASQGWRKSNGMPISDWQPQARQWHRRQRELDAEARSRGKPTASEVEAATFRPTRTPEQTRAELERRWREGHPGIDPAKVKAPRGTTADPVALKAYQDARRLLDARAACERRAS
uniref:Uncharacterized protein n=1 Tax=Siphoviridae sp. ctjbm8 TaxID=2825634 RepID=A0A8S5VGB8_9CAUD|nr:MAG TPA: hypothetical protein [Siphoviridae sp. ctjbm8]